MTESVSRHLASSQRLVVLLLALFVVVGVVRYWNADAEDLASSYVGCRLLADHHPEALFNYDPDNFAGIGPGDIWQKTGAANGFTGFIHPYVQTPLWGYSLLPLCRHTRFPAFSRLFCGVVLLSFAGSIWLIGRFWTPWLLRPLPIALLLLCLWFSQPFGYAMFLMQTHALYFFLTIAALILAEQDHPIPAGLLLAGAAAVKVTPGIFLVYWLLTRRWKAAASLVAWSALLMLGTVLAVGPHLTATYFASLQRISRVLLVSENNQSFAAWVMGRFHPEDDIYDVDIFPLPTALRLGSMALMLAFTALGGWIDRQRLAAPTRPEAVPGNAQEAAPQRVVILTEAKRREGPAFQAPTPPQAAPRASASAPFEVPIGAMMTLVAVTLFAPIAWTHYSVILLAPLMVFCQEAYRLRASRAALWTLTTLIALILLLNFRPLATDVIHMDVGDHALLRGQFYAGSLCLLTVAVLAWLRHRQNDHLTRMSEGFSGHSALRASS